jgi:hypothetical protein
MLMYQCLIFLGQLQLPSSPPKKKYIYLVELITPICKMVGSDGQTCSLCPPVLDPMALVDDKALEVQRLEAREVRLQDLEVQHRDVGAREGGATALRDVHRGIGDPALGLPLPIDLQGRRADDHGREGSGRLQRYKCLHCFAEAHQPHDGARRG